MLDSQAIVRRIEEPVFERRRIDEDKVFEVRVYAFLQGQIHQYRAGEHGAERQPPQS